MTAEQGTYHKTTVLIVGAGPAGSQAAQALLYFGVPCILVDKNAKAGGLQKFSPYQNNWCVSNYFQTGMEIADNIDKNMTQDNIIFFRDTQAENIQEDKNGFITTVQRPDGIEYIHSIYVVIATGVIPNKADIPVKEGIFFGPGNHIENYDFTGLKVAILGGGDNAFDNYHFIAKKNPALLKIFARSLKVRPNMRENVPLSDIHVGDYHVDTDNLCVNNIEFDKFCVFYGWRPLYPFDALKLQRWDKEFLQVDSFCRTSHPRIFAVGEVTARTHPCIVTSMADGMIAAKAIEQEIHKFL